MFLIDISCNGQFVYNVLVNQLLDVYLINDFYLEGYGFICYINDLVVIIGCY